MRSANLSQAERVKMQHSDRLAKILATALLLASPIGAQAECLAPLLVAPVSGATISETRPLLRLEPPASQSTSAVRIKIDARVPEGREVARIEARLTPSDAAQTSFSVPRSLADGERRTKVRVELVAECGAGVSVPASRWFVVDASSACAMPASTKVGRTSGEISWSPASAANEYVVCWAAACRRVQANRVAVADAAIAAVIAITPLCNDATGAARVLWLE